MNKQEFLKRLGAALSGLPEEDAAERLSFYEEMIDDRVEEGLSEETAVAEIGPVEAVAAQIVEETPLPKIVRERMKPKRRLRTWEILLLVLGSPLWLALLIAGAAVVFAVYVVIWALIVSLWAVELSVAVSALGCLAAGAVLLWRGDAARGLLGIAAGLVLAGLAILFFFVCLALTKAAAKLTGKIAFWIKSLFLRKETEQ